MKRYELLDREFSSAMEYDAQPAIPLRCQDELGVIHQTAGANCRIGLPRTGPGLSRRPIISSKRRTFRRFQCFPKEIAAAPGSPGKRMTQCVLRSPSLPAHSDRSVRRVCSDDHDSSSRMQARIYLRLNQYGPTQEVSEKSRLLQIRFAAGSPTSRRSWPVHCGLPHRFTGQCRVRAFLLAQPYAPSNQGDRKGSRQAPYLRSSEERCEASWSATW